VYSQLLSFPQIRNNNKYSTGKMSESDEARGGAGGGGPENSEGDFSVSEVLIELDDNLKSKLVADLMSICDVDEKTARFTLEAHRWNMQVRNSLS
jgi:hypothetical protein